MRILFYLPVVTPWWFANIVEPLIRRVSASAEVFVLAPEPWRNTGIGPDEMQRCADLADLRWCIVDDADHSSLRSEPADRDGVRAFVRALEPDYVFCRSADIETARGFPGRVRFLMEAGLAPFPLPPHWVALLAEPFDHGLVPPLTAEDRVLLDSWIAPAWSRLQARFPQGPDARATLLERCGIDPERPFLLLPLEYEHEENFFTLHRVGASPNHRLVEEVAAAIGPRVSLAVSNHPLNDLYVDRSQLEATVAALGDNVVLVPGDLDGVGSTAALARHADAMIVGDSKAYALAAFFERPLLRRSRFATGAWLSAYSEFEPLLDDLKAGAARRPDGAEARIAAAFHLLNSAFDPQDEALAQGALLRRFDSPVDPIRWPAAVSRLEKAMPELFA